jgi:hypothetical protein
MNGGDQLARGAKSAAFPASEGNVSQEKWDAIFNSEEATVFEYTVGVPNSLYIVKQGKSDVGDPKGRE